jgi:hypothetical protein
MAKMEKVKIISCEQCIYWHQMGESVEGICTVSEYHAYRKRNQYCEKAIKRRAHESTN